MCRESGALWSGIVEGDLWRAEEVHFHHELCDDQARYGFLELSEDAKFALYEELASKKRKLVALLHTHPSKWVGLSLIDKQNQVSSRIGFWSIVVPCFGLEPWDITRMGVHTREARGWRRLRAEESKLRFIVDEK